MAGAGGGGWMDGRKEPEDGGRGEVYPLLKASGWLMVSYWKKNFFFRWAG